MSWGRELQIMLKIYGYDTAQNVSSNIDKYDGSEEKQISFIRVLGISL